MGKKKKGSNKALPVGMSQQTASGTRQQTERPGARQQTAPPDARQQTAPPDARQQTAPPDARQQTAPPGARQQTAPPGARQQTAPPDARQQTAPPGARQQTAPPGARQQTAPLGARQPTSPPGPKQQTDSPQSDHPQAKGGAMSEWREISPEKVGFEFKEEEREVQLPRKPGFNKFGYPIRLISNCFSLRIPCGNVYHYDVEIFNASHLSTTTVENKIKRKDKKYRCLNTQCNRKVFDHMVRNDASFTGILPVYDGRKNMFTRHPLKFCTDAEREVTLSESDSKPEVFLVYIKPVKKKDTNDCSISLDPVHALFAGKVSSIPRETVMAIETVLKHRSCMQFSPFGNSFFYPPQYPNPLGSCKEIWSGFHQSMRLGQKMPMLNLDISASTFLQEGPLLKYLAAHFNCDIEGLRQVTISSSTNLKGLNDMLRNVRVESTHMSYRRKDRIVGFSNVSAYVLEFEMEEVDGRKTMTTVAKYFAKRYKINLQFPNLPCVQVHPKNKNRFLPIEVCEVSKGQRYNGALQSDETAQMVRDTSYPPRDRFEEIHYISTEKAKFNMDPYLREFGFSVNKDPLRVEGRVLETPTIKYHALSDDSIVKPRNGSWNMIKKKFLAGANVRSWALVSFADLPPRDVERFAIDLSSFAGRQGMCMAKCKTISTLKMPRNVDLFDAFVEDVIGKLKRQYQIELIVVVIPRNRPDRSQPMGVDKTKVLYRTVKDVSSKLEVASQCVKQDNVKSNPSLISNLLLKINAKLGGTNNSLNPSEMPSFMRSGIMFVGADVTHPSPTADIPCSVAAVVGSLNDTFSLYEVVARAQINETLSKVSKEVIKDMKPIMMKILKAYYSSNGNKLPHRIVIYRDGVSDGEFEQVQDQEVIKIRDACRSIHKDYNPGVTYLVMQKRHHVRTMPENSRDGVGKMGNPPPGTLIDNTITHPQNYDFYLYGHFGLQGTSRPAYLTVVQDDDGIKETDMHSMTYNLCYTYARCTKSISSPAPARYAHLAAFTGRQRLLKHKKAQPQRKGPYDPEDRLTLNELREINDMLSGLKFKDIV